MEKKLIPVNEVLEAIMHYFPDVLVVEEADGNICFSVGAKVVSSADNGDCFEVEE